ncbi:MAG: DUF6884 domain-containing protein, partial [Polyangiales bacterium]
MELARFDASSTLVPRRAVRASTPKPPSITKRIVLVGCGKSKASEPCPARDLYVGNLFRASLAYAEALAADAVFIVSARHYLLPLDRVIAPYDETLTGKVDWQVRAWGEYVAKEVENHCDPQHTRMPSAWGKPNPRVVAHVVLLAGETYAAPLRLAIAARVAWTLNEPLAGLMLGER